MKTEILTKKFLNLNSTPKGGYNKTQLAIIGVAWPPEKDWQTTVVGNQFPAGALADFARAGKSRQTLDAALKHLRHLRVNANHVIAKIEKGTGLYLSAFSPAGFDSLQLLRGKKVLILEIEE